MSITVIYKRKESKHKVSITRSTLILASIVAIALLVTGAWSLQYYYHQQLVQEKITSLKQRESIKQQYLTSIESYKNQQLHVLAEKIAQLEINNIHLNSLGEQLIEKSEFPKEEFELPSESVEDDNEAVDNTEDEEVDPEVESPVGEVDSTKKTQTEQMLTPNSNTQGEQKPDQGVPKVAEIKATNEIFNAPVIDATRLPTIENVQLSSLNDKIASLEILFNKTQNLLEQLEITYNSLHLIGELFISGYPVPIEGSRISSPFGTRTDPFTGQLRRHEGIDIAGHIGMPILATAAGVVITSEARPGYGYVIVINHGNGLMTRYAHALSLIVSVGAVVEKGQQIGVMGTTGRSTGPHVHYEVLENGTQVNPINYIRRAS